MKSTKHRILLACLGLFLAAPVLASSHKPAAKSASRSVEKKTTKPAQVRNKTASTQKAKARATSKSPSKPTSKSRSTAVKTSVRAEPALRSPISSNALMREGSSPEIKVRSAPERAYAVDGTSFFYQGRKYRIDGLSSAGNSDMAKQRLQRMLESGSLAVDPLKTDESGTALANVRVNGRNLADELR